MKDFQMMVKDTFYMKGLTVFSGPISPEVGFIRSCDCEVVVNDKVIAYVHIDSEMLPRPNDPARRSISTSESNHLAPLGLGAGGFIIRSKRR